MATVAGIDKKIQRATFQANQLESKITHYTDRDPFTIRVDKEDVADGHVGRLVAIKNPAVEEPGRFTCAAGWRDSLPAALVARSSRS